MEEKEEEEEEEEAEKDKGHMWEKQDHGIPDFGSAKFAEEGEIPKTAVAVRAKEKKTQEEEEEEEEEQQQQQQ